MKPHCKEDSVLKVYLSEKFHTVLDSGGKNRTFCKSSLNRTQDCSSFATGVCLFILSLLLALPQTVITVAALIEE